MQMYYYSLKVHTHNMTKIQNAQAEKNANMQMGRVKKHCCSYFPKLISGALIGYETH